MNDFTFTTKGFEHYMYWQIQDKKTLKRINALLKDIKTNGALKGTGKPEKLKYCPGYSRRIIEEIYAKKVKCHATFILPIENCACI